MCCFPAADGRVFPGLPGGGLQSAGVSVRPAGSPRLLQGAATGPERFSRLLCSEGGDCQLAGRHTGTETALAESRSEQENVLPL